MATVVELPLPANVGVGIVIGTFAKIQKSTTSALLVTVPLAGTVTFTPAPAAFLDVSAPVPVTLLPTPVSVALDATGGLSQQLLATDDTDLNPVGWTWAVSFAFTDGTRLAGFNISVPQGQTVDLTGDITGGGTTGGGGTGGGGTVTGGDVTVVDVDAWSVAVTGTLADVDAWAASLTTSNAVTDNGDSITLAV